MEEALVRGPAGVSAGGGVRRGASPRQQVRGEGNLGQKST